MNKLMLTYLLISFLFLSCAGLLIGFAILSEAAERAPPTISNIAFEILLRQCPLTGAIVNAIFMFATFLVSLPALALPMNRGWLKLQGWLVVLCSVFTLSLGLFVWFDTLQTRSNLNGVWGRQGAEVQSLLQQRFNCCGYLDSTSPPFIRDTTCPSASVAAMKGGCVGPFSAFANNYLDLIFTAAFGIVGVDVLLLLCNVMVLKYRYEQERYKHIDEKNGF
ncbi:hypothetical protein EJ06DRAFT_469708 [Trichodelitschia bisporula]|uniref:Tetraspanin n=1 Tax=Trichodelitschia bisporula TaxID=703511 RepID=A0A6G1I862_9PEZI|nr:hypothetical protein EJ06DRAFT_469708 [Trichodelitschia bisporula]